MAFRKQNEPAGRPCYYPALAGAQVVPVASNVLVEVVAANKSASAASLTVSDGGGVIASLEVPANSTEHIFGEPGVAIAGTVTVTTSAAMDVTVVAV